MSDFSLVNGLQSELNALSIRRRSLESDILYLEHKIIVVNQNFKENAGNTKKMMSLMEFLETEKQRIKQKKLKKINVKAKILINKINIIRDSRKNSFSSENIGRKLSQLSANENLYKSKEYYSRPKSIQLPTKNYSYTSRKYQSLPISRPHTSNGSEKFTVQSDQQNKGSTTHLPMCMSMNVCKECTDMRNFFFKMKDEKEIVEEMHKSCSKNNCDAFLNGKCDSPCNIGSKSEDSNNYTYDSTILSTNANPNQIHYCMRCKAEINDSNGQSKNFRLRELNINSDYAKLQSKWTDEENRTEIFNNQPSQKCSFASKYSIGMNPSISASILATCESYAFCECCNNNLSRISMPTPSPSIVEIACKSQNCTKCTEALLESVRKDSSSSPKCISHEILCMKSTHSSDSIVSLRETSIKSLKQDGNFKYPRKMLCEEIKKEIEHQNQVIFDTKDQMSKLLKLKESDEKLIQLKKSLEIENWKLSDMENLAKIEELKSKEMIS